MAWVRDRALHSRLPTVEVGRLLGVEVNAPLYSGELRRLAPEIPVECLVSSGQGKLLLREYLKAIGFEDIALRPKTPVNEGSGSLKILEEFSAKLSPQDYELLVEKLEFKAPSPLHAWLALRLLNLNVEPPPREYENPCPICGRRLTGGYCRFCGAYVSPGGVTLHYSGFKP